MAEPHKKKKRNRNRHDPNRARAAAQREEARRRQREERRKAALAAEKKQKRMAIVKRWGRYAIIGISVTAIALLVFRQSPEVEGFEAPAQLATGELVPGTSSDYGTGTPTSGNYYKDAQACGVFEEQITSEEAATAVYYGAVVLWYDPEIPTADLNTLQRYVDEYETHVVVSPQAGLDSPIVATAWRRLARYDSADGVDEFIDIYRKRGHDVQDCPNQG